MSEKNVILEDDTKGVEIWNKVLKGALSIPGAMIDRESFIKKEFANYVGTDILELAIERGPGAAGVDIKILDKIADEVIRYHTFVVTSISFTSGLPGGWVLMATIPADIAQFYYNVIQTIQKIAYIYGWNTFEKEKMSDELLAQITLFLGVMSGLTGAKEALKVASDLISKQIVKKLPQMALTKTALYPIIKKIATMLGVKITKETFAKGVSKIIPILGGIISGGLTAVTFMPMAGKLKKYLRSLPLATGQK